MLKKRGGHHLKLKEKKREQHRVLSTSTCMKIVKKFNVFFLMFLKKRMRQGRIQDFKLGGGGALKKIAPSGGRRENCWGISGERIRPCEGTPIESPIFVSY